MNPPGLARFLPRWLDDSWDTDVRQIQPHALKGLRPAILDKDHVRNPTFMAKRFGIAMDRQDGRSCTTPTTEKGLAGAQDNGDAFNFQDAQQWAANFANNHGRYRADVDWRKINLDATDDPRGQRRLEAYKELLDEQDYQSVLFRDVTTDEVGLLLFDFLMY